MSGPRVLARVVVVVAALASCSQTHLVGGIASPDGSAMDTAGQGSNPGSAGTAGGSAGAGVAGGGAGVPPPACPIACGGSCVNEVCRDGISRWPMLGGDVHHSGFNAAEQGHPPLQRAWIAAIPESPLSAAVSDGQRVYVSGMGGTQDGTFVAAISPADGKTLWTWTVLGAIGGLGQPSVEDGRVVVTQCGSWSPHALHAISTSAGTTMWSHPLACQSERLGPPLLAGGRAYFQDNGYDTGFGAALLSDGRGVFAIGQSISEPWSPMYLRGGVYTFHFGLLKRYDFASGALLFTAGATNDPRANKAETPASDGELAYGVAGPRLLAFAPGELEPRWSVTAAYSGVPAIADGRVYAISGGQLRVHDAGTGAVLWTFPADNAITYPPVVAGRWVYVASNTNVFAVDTASRESVWRDSPGGALSIANGQLYVSQYANKLVAYDLTR